MNAHSITLEVTGQRITGWAGGRIGWDLNQFCGDFSLASRGNAQELPKAVPLGAKCKVALHSPQGEQTALVGMIDSISHEVAAQEVRTVVAGRSASADLVDCAAPLQAWQNQSALQIAHALTSSFGLQVADKAGLSEPFAHFATRPGESVAQALVRLARLGGAWVGDVAPAGHLRFFIPGKGRAPYQLSLQKHLISTSATTNRAPRFGQVQVLGETPGGNTIEALAMDAGSQKMRRHVLLAEEPCLPAALQARANWERGVRLASSTSATIDMQRWDALARLLPVGGLVRLKASQGGLNGDALVQGVRVFLSEEGPKLSIYLTHPAAYQAKPNPSALARPFLIRST